MSTRGGGQESDPATAATALAPSEPASAGAVMISPTASTTSAMQRAYALLKRTAEIPKAFMRARFYHAAHRSRATFPPRVIGGAGNRDRQEEAECSGKASRWRTARKGRPSS